MSDEPPAPPASENASQSPSIPTAPVKPRSATLRASIAAAVSLLTFALVAVVRHGLFEFGATVHALMNREGLGVLAPAGLLVGCAVLVSVAAVLIARLDGGRIPILIGLVGAAGIYVPRYLASLSAPIDFDFHGIPTNSPSQVWPEFSRFRKKVLYRVNAHGLRGDDFVEAKKPGVVRIALVGDSFIFGMGVEENETLKAELESQARAHGLGDRVEVLNLGLPGSNLPTHIRMYEIARRHLQADVVVMGLFVWNDLSKWDCEDEYLGRLHVGAYSVFSWLVGSEPASIIMTRLFVQHGSHARSLAAFDALAPKLSAAREPLSESPALVVLEFNPDPAVTARVSALPEVRLVETPFDKQYFIPDDGHPSPAGNKLFGELVWKQLETLPVVKAALAQTGK